MVGRLTLIASCSALLVLCSCLEDEVRFGPPGNLRVRGGAGGGSSEAPCSFPPGTDELGTTCPSWITEVFPKLDDPLLYACTKDGCHGGINGAANLSMPAGDPAGSYDALVAYKNAAQRAYIGADNPYFMCNVWPQSPQRIDPIMPIPIDGVQIVSDADLTLLGNWAACGFGELDVGVGPGAGGGAVGVGGAGGGI